MIKKYSSENIEQATNEYKLAQIKLQARRPTTKQCKTEQDSQPRLRKLGPILQRNILFMVKRCYEERIHKSFNQESKYNEIQKEQKMQFNNITGIDKVTKYKMLNHEKIVKGKLSHLSQLYQEQLIDCVEQVPQVGQSLELVNTGFNSDSPLLRSFQKSIQKRGMIFSDDNQFEQKLLHDQSLRKKTIAREVINKQTSITLEKEPDYKIRSQSYNDQKIHIYQKQAKNKQKRRISINNILNVAYPHPMLKLTLSTTESDGSQSFQKSSQFNKTILGGQCKFQRQRTIRTAILTKLPLFPVDIDLEDPNLFILFHSISQKKPYTFPQLLEITRSQFEVYLNKILFNESLTIRALNFLQFQQNTTFQNYKKWLGNLNTWTKESILFFSFHLFDTNKKGILESSNLMGLLKLRKIFEQDILRLINYHQANKDTTNQIIFQEQQDQCSKLLQQPDLTYSLYRQYLQQDVVKNRIIEENRKKRKRPFTFSKDIDVEIKRIFLKESDRSKSFTSPVKDLYEDTKQLKITYPQFCSVFADTIPTIFISFIQAISLRRVLSHKNTVELASYIQISQEL